MCRSEFFIVPHTCKHFSPPGPPASVNATTIYPQVDVKNLGRGHLDFSIDTCHVLRNPVRFPKKYTSLISSLHLSATMLVMAILISDLGDHNCLLLVTLLTLTFLLSILYMEAKEIKACHSLAQILQWFPKLLIVTSMCPGC